MKEYCTAGHAPDDNITRRMRIACWVPKATNTHSEYDFLLPQLLYERASILRYTHRACFVIHQYMEIHVVSSDRTNIISLYLFVSSLQICNITLTMVNEPVDRVTYPCFRREQV